MMINHLFKGNSFRSCWNLMKQRSSQGLNHLDHVYFQANLIQEYLRLDHFSCSFSTCSHGYVSQFCLSRWSNHSNQFLSVSMEYSSPRRRDKKMKRKGRFLCMNIDSSRFFHKRSFSHGTIISHKLGDSPSDDSISKRKPHNEDIPTQNEQRVKESVPHDPSRSLPMNEKTELEYGNPMASKNSSTHKNSESRLKSLPGPPPTVNLSTSTSTLKVQQSNDSSFSETGNSIKDGDYAREESTSTHMNEKYEIHGAEINNKNTINEKRTEANKNPISDKKNDPSVYQYVTPIRSDQDTHVEEEVVEFDESYDASNLKKEKENYPSSKENQSLMNHNLSNSLPENEILQKSQEEEEKEEVKKSREKSDEPDKAVPTGIPKPYKAIFQLKGMIFNEEGTCKVFEGDFKKSDLCNSYTIQPRDLRKVKSQIDLDISTKNQLPAILVRDKSIIVNLGHIQSIIQADNVIILNVVAEDHAYQSLLIHELQWKLGSKDLPFELKALEAILMNVIAKLETEEEALLPKIKEFLVSLNDYVNQEKLKELLMHRRDIANFERKIEAIRGCIDEILNNDEDLTGLYITDKVKGIHRPVTEHMEAELLLEHYSKVVGEIFDRVSAVSSDMSTTEGIIHIVLDKQRNNLILFDLKANLAAVSLATGTFFTSIFGMNLISNLETLPGLFYIACGISSVITFMVYRRFMRSLGMIRPGKLNTVEELQKLLKK